MLRRFRAKFPILYCIAAEALFLGGMTLGSFVLSLAVYAGWLGPLAEEEYGLILLPELVGVAVAAGLLAATGRWSLVRRRGCGLLRGLKVGAYPLVLISIAMLSNILFLLYAGDLYTLRAPWRILLFLLAMLAVGVAEEWLFRAVIAETLLEHFGADGAGVWKATVISGLLFGAAHLVNLSGSALTGVLVQCVLAFALGMLFSAIYYRTGNIRVTIFLHVYTNLVGLLLSGLYDGGSFSDVVSSYGVQNLFSALLYFIPVLFLLRGKKRCEIRRAFAPELQ
jgi:membrane protease YdiL (CAAX protease family)